MCEKVKFKKMFKLCLKNPPRTFLTLQSSSRPGNGQFWYPRQRIPLKSRNCNKIKMLAKTRGSEIKPKNLYTLGFLCATTAAVTGAVNFANMSEVNSKVYNKTRQHSINQHQLKEAYDILKTEMGFPQNESKLDDWDQLVFVVRAAINIKQCKEEIANMRKEEEMLLQESMDTDQAMRQRAEELFKKKENELKDEYKRDFDLQVHEETARATEKRLQMAKELKDATAIELEHEINLQQALMAREMREKFENLRKEADKSVEEVAVTLDTKHKNLSKQENIIQENKYFVDIRDKCREVEAELRTEMTPGKKWINQLCSLRSLVDAVMNAFPEDDELASAVLRSLPDEIVHRGILTEVALKKRFDRVEHVAQRLALLSNEGPYPGTMYLASYIRSMLTLRPAENPAAQPEQLNGADNTDVLHKARHCVERGDFVRAVKFLEHLKGAPRSVVAGWVEETELLLKVHNAIQVLKSYSSLLIHRSQAPVTYQQPPSV